MCGICGIFNYRSDEPAAEPLVRSMTDAIVHRGPDDDGYHFDGGLGLGMRRLSIIDLEGGSQPICDEAGRHVTVFNGEIYNFRELRAELESYGHAFRTRTDTETIVHAYEQWGFEALRRLNGMFGIALWDAASRMLVLARDPYGIKPLYYQDDGATLRFGSEMRSILCDDRVPRRVDPDALEQYLTFTFIPSPATAFEGVKKVPPGYALVCDQRGSRLRRYHYAQPRELDQRDEATLVAELQTLIRDAVRRQMVADVPVGALLSGGVDSTTTATIMSEIAEGPIDTFTVGFSGHGALDETAYAQATSERLGSSHHAITISSEDYLDFLPTAVWHLEDLVATDSTLAYYRVCELARRSVKVVITGQGADEPFGGYPRHLGERYGWLVRGIPPVMLDRIVAPAVSALPRNARIKRAVSSLGTRDAAKRMVAVWTIADEALKDGLYRPGLRPRQQLDPITQRWHNDVGHLDGLTQMTYMDARLSLADNLLLYGDKMSMAVSLEARVPLLDLDLMHFVERIPPHFKIRGRTRKYILRKAVSKWVPREVLERKKIPFQSPIDAWLRRDMTAQVKDLLLSEDAACAQYFRPDAVRRMIDDHLSGREDFWRLLLALIVFELWHRQFIDASSADLQAHMLRSKPGSGSDG